MGEWLWSGLSPAQAEGHACVVCGRDYLRERAHPTRWVPVGRAEGTTSQVFACVGRCADHAAARCYPGGVMVISDEALTAAGTAFLRACEVAVAATPTGDPRHAHPDAIVTATVAAAAPLIVAAELRRLAEVFDDHAQTLRRDVAEHGDLDVSWGIARAAVWRECAVITRQRAVRMDPAGGAS